MTTLTLGGPIAAHVQTAVDHVKCLIDAGQSPHAAIASVYLQPWTLAEWAYVLAILRADGVDV